MSFTTVYLDKIADSLEARGLIKEALEIDRVADSVDKVAVSSVAQQVSSLLGLEKITDMILKTVITNHMNVILDVITRHLPNAGKQDPKVTTGVVSSLKECDRKINSIPTTQAITPAAPGAPAAPAAPAVARR